MVQKNWAKVAVLGLSSGADSRLTTVIMGTDLGLDADVSNAERRGWADGRCFGL